MDAFALFLNYETKLAESRAAQVASDPLIFAGVKNWPQLDVAGKKAFIERYKRLCETAMGRGFLKLEFYEQAPVNGLVSLGSAGHVSHGDGWGAPIRINTHPAVLNQMDVREILDTIPHELAHNYQFDFMRDPRKLLDIFHDPVLKMMRDNLAAYIKPETNAQGYRQQPMEAHAFAVGNAFAEKITSFVAGRALLPNPHQEAVSRSEYETTGRVAIPGTAGLEPTDPYRHYYFAKAHVRQLAAYREFTSWDLIIQHAGKAVRYGEYMPYDSRPALGLLAEVAGNQLYDDKFAGRIEVPAAMQQRAREALEGFSVSRQERDAINARQMLQRLQKSDPGVATAGGKPAFSL